MDTSTLLFGVMTVTFIGVTFHAWRLNNEPRDVALLGTIGGLMGIGTAVSVVA